MTGTTYHLTWPDYVIFAIVIGISLGIGVFQALSGSRQRTTSEYLVGDRRMSYLPVSLSYTATFMSSIFFLGTPAEMYNHGIHQLFAFYATIPANILSAVFTVPLFHHLKITSAYEYLELRFDSIAARKLGSSFGILTNILYMSVVLFGPAVALEAVAGFPLWTSVLVIGLASVIYTAIGGIKAVVWTDVFQSLIMVGGLVAIVIKSLIDIGGLNRFWDLNNNAHRFDINYSFDPTVARTFWTTWFGGAMKWVSFSFNQSSVLRYVSIPSLSNARKMVLWSTPTFLILSSAAAFEGLCAYSYFANKGCDPFEDGAITNSNQILPYFIMELFHTTPGLPGLFLASLFSASLSTLSSCLSSVSACSLTDFVRPVFPNMTELRATVVAKILVVVFGGVAIGFSFAIMEIKGTVIQIATSLIGAVDGPACAMFFLGGLFPFANKRGAIVGGLVGIGVTLWVSLGSSFAGFEKHRLPPAPTDHCVANVSYSDVFINGSSVLLNATGVNVDILNGFTPVPSSVSPLHNPFEDTLSLNRTGLDRWYSLSFLHHTGLGILVTVLVGILVSLFTGPSKPSDVNPAYVSYLVRPLCYSKKQLDDLEEELNNLHDVKMNLFVKEDDEFTYKHS